MDLTWILLNNPGPSVRAIYIALNRAACSYLDLSHVVWFITSGFLIDDTTTYHVLCSMRPEQEPSVITHVLVTWVLAPIGPSTETMGAIDFFSRFTNPDRPAEVSRAMNGFKYRAWFRIISIYFTWHQQVYTFFYRSVLTLDLVFEGRVSLDLLCFEYVLRWHSAEI